MRLLGCLLAVPALAACGPSLSSGLGNMTGSLAPATQRATGGLARLIDGSRDLGRVRPNLPVAFRLLLDADMVILRGGLNSNTLHEHGIVRHAFDKGGDLSGAQHALFQMCLYCPLIIAAEQSHLVFAKYEIRRAIPPLEFFRKRAF